MAFELLSGPDLGGGLLFQLTLDRSGARPRVTVHAQEGGRDASGPPKGSPVPLGFARVRSPCGIGGSGCFHREFEVDEGELARARLAYNRLRFVFAPMLDQQYAGAPVPIATALAEVRERLATRFDPSGQRWYVGGSTAAHLQGVAVAPHDLDLGTDRAGVGGIADALTDYLIEPVGRTTWAPERPMWAARAYVGTLRSGVRVEWAVGDAPEEPTRGFTEWEIAPAEVPTVTIDLGPGLPVRASRLEFFVVASAVYDRKAPLDAAIAVLRTLGPDRALLERLVAAAPLSEARRSALLARFDG